MITMEALNALELRELHARARDKDAGPPAAFVDVVERIADGERARLERDELVRAARELGVSWVALERWTGIRARHLHRIVDGR